MVADYSLAYWNSAVDRDRYYSPDITTNPVWVPPSLLCNEFWEMWGQYQTCRMANLTTVLHLQRSGEVSNMLFCAFIPPSQCLVKCKDSFILYLCVCKEELVVRSICMAVEHRLIASRKNTNYITSAWHLGTNKNTWPKKCKEIGNVISVQICWQYTLI
jgi:hypothetical protein